MVRVLRMSTAPAVDRSVRSSKALKIQKNIFSRGTANTKLIYVFLKPGYSNKVSFTICTAGSLC